MKKKVISKQCEHNYALYKLAEACELRCEKQAAGTNRTATQRAVAARTASSHRMRHAARAAIASHPRNRGPQSVSARAKNKNKNESL